MYGTRWRARRADLATQLIIVQIVVLGLLLQLHPPPRQEHYWKSEARTQHNLAAKSIPI